MGGDGVRRRSPRTGPKRSRRRQTTTGAVAQAQQRIVDLFADGRGARRGRDGSTGRSRSHRDRRGRAGPGRARPARRTPRAGRRAPGYPGRDTRHEAAGRPGARPASAGEQLRALAARRGAGRAGRRRVADPARAVRRPVRPRPRQGRVLSSSTTTTRRCAGRCVRCPAARRSRRRWRWRSRWPISSPACRQARPA